MSNDRYFVGRARGNRVAGKVAIVTGSGSGIGRAMAELLALEGAKVVVANRNADRGEETVRHMREAGGEGTYIATDLSLEADCVHLVRRTVELYGQLDVLVNNAGIYPRASLEDTTLAFWRTIQATNIEAPFLLCRESIPHMIRGGGGSIINIGSVNGLGGGASLVAYSTSKGALLTLTKNLAGAYAGDYIRVNYLIPGWILTDTEYVIQAIDGHDAAWLEAMKANLPMGRYALPEDSAYGVLYLASDEAWHVNGAILNTDGGQATLGNVRRRPPKPATDEHT